MCIECLPCVSAFTHTLHPTLRVRPPPVPGGRQPRLHFQAGVQSSDKPEVQGGDGERWQSGKPRESEQILLGPEDGCDPPSCSPTATGRGAHP